MRLPTIHIGANGLLLVSELVEVVLVIGNHYAFVIFFNVIDGDDSKALFGVLDSSFLFVYAFAMFFSGFVAERVSLRYVSKLCNSHNYYLLHTLVFTTHTHKTIAFININICF